MAEEVYVPPSPRRDEVVRFVAANPGCTRYRAAAATGRRREADTSGQRAVRRAIELGLVVLRGGRLYPSQPPTPAAPTVPAPEQAAQPVPGQEWKPPWEQ